VPWSQSFHLYERQAPKYSKPPMSLQNFNLSPFMFDALSYRIRMKPLLHILFLVHYYIS
jgi:hypothetical protein